MTQFKRVLVTCPPMLGRLEQFLAPAQALGLQLEPAATTQVLPEAELIQLLQDYDGWIIGDDPATRQVFEAAKAAGLKAAVKWGIGVDNVDFAACRELGIPIASTPNMFGGEVGDVALAYILGLARQTYLIDREIRAGAWPKPAGMSMAGKTVGIVGYGDIGYHTARRLSGFEVKVIAWDPGVEGDRGLALVSRATWPERIAEVDFLVFTCSLNAHNRHMLNAQTLSLLKPGACVVNVARGPLIDEAALLQALHSGQLAAAALDVFETEPLPADSALRELPQCVFGSHNSSNTAEGVARASFEALRLMAKFLHGE
jgi:D-3-phosphoglycerate dehydrogenase